MYTILTRYQASFNLTKSEEVVSVMNIEGERHKALTIPKRCVYGLCNIIIEELSYFSAPKSQNVLSDFFLKAPY
jgi:hypothetical protein